MICYLIDRIVATRVPGRLLCYHKLPAPFASTRTSFLIFKSQLHQSSFVMGDNSKSETEWRAILSPEQVRSSTILVDVYCTLTLYSANSSEFSARREQRRPTQANMTTMTRQAYIVVLGAKRHFTRAARSSTVAVGGPLSLMVMYRRDKLFISLMEHPSNPWCCQSA
jgi:hypothetical protein